jgi:hypothetical protein
MSVCPRCGAGYTPGEFHQCETRSGSRRVAAGCGGVLLVLGIALFVMGFLQGEWESARGAWFSMVPFFFATAVIVACAGIAMMIFFRK